VHVLVIHEFFLRPDEGGGARFNVMTREWVKAGVEVTVVAGQTHYATGYRPKTYALLEESEQDGARVLRTWTPRYDKTSTAARMLGMAAFGASATAILPRVGHFDVCLASSPSLASFAAGLAAARKAPLVAEVRDLWPESAVTVGVVSPNHPAVSAAYALEESTYETADHIVALTPGIARDIVDRGHARPEKITVFPNGVVPAPPLSEFERRSLRRQFGWEGEFVVVYAGAHGRANDLGQLITTAATLTDRRVRFVMVGDGPEKSELRRRAGRNVEWLDPVPHDELRRVLGAADAGAVVLQRNPTFRTVYPNKLFDYMGAGLPVLCGVEGDAAELVTEAGAGLLVRPGDVSDWRRAVVELHRCSPVERAEMGARGRTMVERRFDRLAIAREYLELLRAFTGHSSPQG
jgi:glycosyltransferase involved in cell wall biosynthesis